MTKGDSYKLLTKIDFYPPSDNRTLKSNVVDIYGGDNFADYCNEFFTLLEEEEYYEWLTIKVINRMDERRCPSAWQANSNHERRYW